MKSEKRRIQNSETEELNVQHSIRLWRKEILNKEEMMNSEDRRD